MRGEAGEAAANKDGVTLSDIAPVSSTGAGVTCLEHNHTVAEALKILAQNGILSAPVLISPDLEDFGELRAETPRATLAGWIDVNDCLQELIRALGPRARGNMLQTMAVLEQEGATFAERPLISLLDGKDKRLVYEADSNVPVMDAVRKYFIGGSEGRPSVHRVAIFDSNGQIEKIVSQMDVLAAIAKFYGDADCVDLSVQDAGLVGEQELVAVDITTPTLQALAKLVQHHRSAVAVLSPDGRLITNLSSSDLRYLQPNQFGVLALPVGEFLGLLHGSMYIGNGAVDGDLGTQAQPDSHEQFFALVKGHNEKRKQQQVPLVTLAPDATVMAAIQTLLEHRVHRVYVVDDPHHDLPKPLAVITATDLLQFVASRS